jgi:hypothetical protein
MNLIKKSKNIKLILYLLILIAPSIYIPLKGDLGNLANTLFFGGYFGSLSLNLFHLSPKYNKKRFLIGVQFCVLIFFAVWFIIFLPAKVFTYSQQLQFYGVALLCIAGLILSAIFEDKKIK